MSTAVTSQISSTNSDDTEQLAEKIGHALQGGETIELVSDLGGGKTTFTRGLARGAHSSDVVGSPTFTISKIYETPKFQIHHFDFYRLSDAGIVADELAEVSGDKAVVTVVEWGDVVQHVLPDARLTVTFQLMPDGSRTLTFSADPSLAYLVEAIK